MGSLSYHRHRCCVDECFLAKRRPSKQLRGRTTQISESESLAPEPQDGSLLAEKPGEGKESDRIDSGQFIPKDFRRTGRDAAMTPEDVYCVLSYRSNIDWSLAEEDSAQAKFIRVLSVEDPDRICDGD